MIENEQDVPQEAISKLEQVETEVKLDLKAAIAAVEKWYEGHFHRSNLAGRSPIAAEDKAQLIEHIQQAAQPKE